MMVDPSEAAEPPRPPPSVSPSHLATHSPSAVVGIESLNRIIYVDFRVLWVQRWSRSPPPAPLLIDRPGNTKGRSPSPELGSLAPLMPVGRVPPRGLSVSFEPGGLGRRLRVAADGWHDKRALLRPPVLHGQGQSRLDRATIRARPHPGSVRNKFLQRIPHHSLG